MEDTNTAQAGNAQETESTQGKEEKTFTQAELNSVVQKRLGEERQKYGDYEDLKKKAARLDEIEESNKSELQKATEKAEKLEAELKSIKDAEAIRTMRTSVAELTGVPASLLTGTTEEDCKVQAKAILEFAKAYEYPALRDGGEAHNTSKKSTGQQFADWMMKNTK